MPGPTRDPEQVGPYRIVGRLGAGGMGVVYAGVDAAGQRAAVKLIHDSHAADQEFRARFRREVAMLRRVRGACCVRILADGAGAARPWLATEYIAGLTLTEHVAEHGPLRGDELYGLAAGLAEALTAVHAAGVVHRDLKPSNVMLSPDGPRLVDFGIARALDGTALTATGHVVGSPGWVSPEEYAGGPTGPAADVYGWALVVVYAATGRQPYGSERPEVLALRVLRNPVDTTALPPALRALADRALSKAPEQRPAMGEVLAAVATAWRGQPVAPVDAAADITDRVKRTWPSRTGSAPPWPGAAPGPSGQPATVPPRRRVKVVPVAAVATAAVLTGVILLNTLPGATTAQGPDATETTGQRPNATEPGEREPTSTTGRDVTPATEPATRTSAPAPRTQAGLAAALDLALSATPAATFSYEGGFTQSAATAVASGRLHHDDASDSDAFTMHVTPADGSGAADYVIADDELYVDRPGARALSLEQKTADKPWFALLVAGTAGPSVIRDVVQNSTTFQVKGRTYSGGLPTTTAAGRLRTLLASWLGGQVPDDDKSFITYELTLGSQNRPARFELAWKVPMGSNGTYESVFTTKYAKWQESGAITKP
ncbi:serine/threonine-protein kinase [Nonomuraea sp. NPDC004580]|uniref:serine/threonine-protein kinase n=1 Tax=Nonomuraea sp. NPDC004580 TaxID=3154552 RepID=UPI0033B61CAF